MDKWDNRVRFQHGYVGDGRYTVAYYLDAEKGKTRRVKAAVSWCSPRDNFKKSKGRQIALGGLTRDKKIVEFEFECQHSLNYSAWSAIDSLLHDHLVIDRPQWA